MSSRPRIQPTPSGMVRALAGALLLAAAGCAVDGDAIQRANDYLALGNSYQAFMTIEEAREEAGGPDGASEQLEQEYWRIRRVYLLDKAKLEIFTDHEKQALATLGQLLALDPDSERAQRWMAKAKTKLASRITAEADELRGTGDLEGALAGYTEALFYLPGFAPALTGQRLVLEAQQKRNQKASEYLLKGLRKERENRVVQSEYNGGAAVEFDPSLQEAERLQSRSNRALARDAYANALELKESGNYGAARLEFMRVLRHDPQFSGAIEAVERMDEELESQRLRVIADGVIARGDYDAVDELLDRSFRLTQLEKGAISELRAKNREARWTARYEDVRNLEVQGEFQLAIDGYRGILEEWPEGFLDAQERIIGLEEGMQLAGEAYREAEAAEAAGDLPAARAAFARAELLLPGYRDAADRAVELERRMQREPSGTPAPQGG